MPRKPFYADGIRFQCQGSGNCCTSRGAYGYVYLTLADRQRYAKFFELTTREFIKKYCNRKMIGDTEYISLRNPSEMPAEFSESMKGHAEGDCIFLKEKRCSTYEARPEQCRTWPFWPENMSAKVWTKELAEYCPGVGKGKLYSAEEIEVVLKNPASYAV
jgi:Fe-S-cluster containining protein